MSDARSRRSPRRGGDIRLRRTPNLRLGAVVAAAVAVAFLAWLLFIRDDGSSSDQPKPVATSAGDLRALSASVGHPIYWAGPRGGSELELTQTDAGNIYVRYLDPGTKVGDPKPAYLTVGTYPVPDALGALKKVSQRPGAKTRKVKDGGLVVTNSKSPNSVYLAYPGSNLQVEVYDPKPSRALSLAVSGQVTPVG